MITSYYRRRI